MKRFFAIALLALAGHSLAAPPDIGFAPQPGQAVPASIVLRDAVGRRFTLGTLYGRHPTVLMLGYYRCPNLCGAVWAGLASAISQIEQTPGRDFELLVASIDPRETPAEARARRDALAARFDQADVQRWRFATGDAPQLRALAQALGYRYRYDERQRQFAHAAGLVVLDSAGRIARYLAGVQFEPQNLRLALLDSAAPASTRGGVLQAFRNQVLLLCYHYDPVSGRYSARINRILQLGCGATVLALAGLVFGLQRRARGKAAR